ncbi:MAG: hypothetical protein ACKKL4_00780 [Patescibacteria group bacterium]
MSKKVFGVKKQGSIRDIPIPNRESVHKLDLGASSGENGGSNKATHRENSKDSHNNHHMNNRLQNTKQNMNKQIGIKLGILGVFVLLLLTAYSYFFHSATVVVQERSTEAVLAGEALSASITSEDATTLSFTRVGPITKTETLFVEGTQEENRQTKATGELIVYNTDSTEKNYIKNTRFATENGLVYRAFNRFSIPKGSEENPGSTRVLVVAENPGEKYNSESGLSFTLPALKEQGDPAYDAIRAEQGEALTGGYSGIVKVPSDQDIQEAQVKLGSRLDGQLFDVFKASLEEGTISFPIFMSESDPTFTEEVNEQKEGVDVVARTQLYGIAFDKSEFQKAIAEKVLGQDVNLDGVTITNIDELEFALTDNEFDPEKSENVSFTVTGKGQFVWKVDEEQVKDIVAGKLKSHIENNLVAGVSELSITSVDVSPFWRRLLPKKSDNIRVIIDSQN